MQHREYQSIADSMARRSRQLPSRLVIGGLVAAVSFPLTSWAFALGWFAVYAGLQLIEHRLHPEGPLARRLTQRRYVHLCLLLTVLNNVVFSAYGAAEILGGTAIGVLCGTLVIGGVIINAVMFSPGSRTLVITALAPQSLYLPLVPYGAWQAGFTAMETGQLTFAAAMLVLAGVTIRTQISRLFAELQAAKALSEQASEAKSLFLATVSHEIRTPLNGVLGMAQVMAADDLPPRQRERLNVITQSGQSLLQILGDVLDLAKVEAGKLDLEVVVFDLNEVVGRTRDTFQALAESKGLRFRVEVAPEASGLWRGDPTRLRQILANLISNAVKFTDAGEVSVDARVREGRLILTVADTGPGVTPEQMPRLFKKFVQADDSTTRRYGGTGLGLSICGELAQLMGGTIEARRLEPHGLAFEVVLPLERAEPADLPKAEDFPADAFAGGWLRVLAADDHPVNRQVLALLLGQAGITPHLVENGAEALEAWRVGDYDVILMDVQMPVMDGPSAAAAIRAEEAASRRPRTPIIALTANVMNHQVEAYRVVGMDRSVAKPIEVQALLAAIEAAVTEEPDAEVVQAA